MNRVLVTGASGFVGRHALAPLRRRGYEVHAACRRPLDEGGPAGDETTWHRADLFSERDAAVLMDAVRPTHLLHLAWHAEPGSYEQAAENARWVEVSLALLRAFAAGGGRRAVIAGTCAEYDPGEGPCVEDRTRVRPRNLYSAAKHDLHAVASAHAAQQGVELAWARIFFLHGPHERPARLVPSVARSVIAGRPIPTTDGAQVRDFLHVADAGDALAALVDSSVGGPVNVASGQAVTVRQVAELTAGLAGRLDLLRVGELARRPGDPPVVVASVERLADQVGWRPSASLEQGLALTVDWWRQQSG